MTNPLRLPPATQLYAEAQQAADAVMRQFACNAGVIGALVDRLKRTPPRFIVTCARGSSDHAATFAKYLFEIRLGLITASAAPSLASVHAVKPRLDGALFVVISQSGKSPDLLRSAELARAAGAIVVALVNVADSPLAALADVVIPLHAGPEISIAASKSYLCSLSALLHLTACWSGDVRLQAALAELPEALRMAWAQDWSPLVEGLTDARGLFVVARGVGLGAAQEAALKLKETCGLHAEAFSSAEVMHGPMAIVGPGLPVLCFAQDDSTLHGTLDAAAQFRRRGAPVWVAAPGVQHDGGLPQARSPHPACSPLLAIASFYRAANALAIARGRDPDAPPHLRKVTETT
ncbi:MAG: SIS domain-containing protein [Luteimonas sp.]